MVIRRGHLTLVSSDDYRGLHGAPSAGEGSAPFHDVEQVMPDWYEHPEYYKFDEPDMERETIGAIKRARGNPNAPVTIYRGLPRGHTEINSGDWVTPSANYARRHGYDASEPDKDMPVIKATVRAGDLWTNGDSHHEWGYAGPKVSGTVHFTGGEHSARMQHPASSWRPLTADMWWQFGDYVVGSDGRGSGGRQSWECYDHGKIVAIKHSLAEARSYFEDRVGPLAWTQADLTPVKYDHPYFGTTEEFTAPTRVWYADQPG